MEIVTELIYNILEALLITMFISGYFKPKPKFAKYVSSLITFSSLTAYITVVTIFELNWIITLVMSILFMYAILTIFYQGNVLEYLLVAAVVFILELMVNLSVISLMSIILNVEYSSLVVQSNISRFLTVMITKLIYMITLVIILSFKKKYIFLFHKLEYIVITFTFFISGILMSLVRNMMFNSQEDSYKILLVLLCLLVLNIVIYFTMIYISKKNLDEKSISVMKKEIEMQEINIHDLEQKYEKMAKFRHDVKNYILCALNIAESNGDIELIEYLRDVFECKLNSMSEYVKTDRRILNAVINSKLSYASENDIHVQCTVMSGMEDIEDIDIGILLANLIDNAVEACKYNEGDSLLSLNLWDEAGYYCLDIANTVEKDILSDNPQLLTIKEDKELHGIGLRTVYEIVEKYNGIISFKQKLNMFHVYVSLAKIGEK